MWFMHINKYCFLRTNGGICRQLINLNEFSKKNFFRKASDITKQKTLLNEKQTDQFFFFCLKYDKTFNNKSVSYPKLGKKERLFNLISNFVF